METTTARKAIAEAGCSQMTQGLSLAGLIAANVESFCIVGETMERVQEEVSTTIDMTERKVLSIDSSLGRRRNLRSKETIMQKSSKRKGRRGCGFRE